MGNTKGWLGGAIDHRSNTKIRLLKEIALSKTLLPSETGTVIRGKETICTMTSFGYMYK